MRVLRFAGTEDFISISGQKFSKRDQWLKLLFYIIFFSQGLPSPYKNPLFFLLHYMHGPCVVPKPAAKRFSGVGDGSLPLWGLVRKLRLERSVSVKTTVKR